MRAQTLIIALCILIGIVYLAWQMINSSLASNARKAQNKRKSDRIILTGNEKQSYKHAQKLYTEGNFRASAKILESLGMLRESINILENAGFIREAADALIRIQRPNRAGTIFARHGFWKDAMDCFKKANMPLDVAKCARELGDLPTAIPYFLEAGASFEAAECYLELGKHHEASKLFLKEGEFDQALEQYGHLVDNDSDIEKIEFSEEELDFITNQLIQGRSDLKLADILVAKNRSVKLVAELIKDNNLKSATAVYMRSTRDIGPKLIGYNDFNREDNLRLGLLFSNAGAYEYGGMVFERLEEFERAGDCFDKGELFERAAFCYERAQNKQRSTEMRILAASNGSTSKRRVPDEQPSPIAQLSRADKLDRINNPFAFTNVGIDDSPDRKPSVPTSTPASPPGLSQKPSESLSKEEGDQFDVFLSSSDFSPPPLNPINWENFFLSEFMADLSSQEQNTMRSLCKTKEYPKNSVILDFHQEPLGIYFVLSGSVSIAKLDDHGREQAFKTIQPSDIFGEMWLLLDQPTEFKFVTRTQCQIGWIKRADFESLTDKNGSLARKLYKRYALKLVNKLVFETPREKKQTAS